MAKAKSKPLTLILKVLGLVLCCHILFWNNQSSKLEKEVGQSHLQSPRDTAATTTEWGRRQEEGPCPGREDYKKWIDELFALAPQPAPNCHQVEGVVPRYNNTEQNPYVQGSIVLQRQASKWKVFHVADPQREPYTQRSQMMQDIWKQANERRRLPPNLELILYLNDKPRVQPNYHYLPIFTFPSYHPIGSGSPKAWHDHIPFPSFNYLTQPPATKLSRQEFFRRNKQVYFRGYFSEMEWTQPNATDELLTSLPRFKLAHAVATASEHDKPLLNIKLTGFNMPKRDPLYKQRKTWLKDQHNILVGGVGPSSGNATLSLAVSGHGWAGTSTMKGLTTSQTTMLYVEDTTSDLQEGWSRHVGEIYFPHLTPNVHYVPCQYDTIAETVRRLNQDDDQTYRIYENAHDFAKTYLGVECALDLVELLAWSYYNYAQSGCPTAFDHVSVQ